MSNLLLEHIVAKTRDEMVAMYSVLDNMANCNELDDESIIDELDVILDDAPEEVVDTISLYFKTRRLTFKQRQIINNFYILYYSIALGVERH